MLICNILRNGRRLSWGNTIMLSGGLTFIYPQKEIKKIMFWLCRQGWEDKISMDLEEIGINAGNWVVSAQDRDYWKALVNATLNLRVR